MSESAESSSSAYAASAPPHSNPPVSETTIPQAAAQPANGIPRAPLAAQLTDIFASLRRLVSLQINIWLAQVRQAVMRMVLMAVLALVALIAAIIGIIFLYAGIFHVLTDMMSVPPVWALLIFAAVHLLFAGILVVIALSLLKKRKAPQKKTISGGAS